jgi:hypothetical protein
MAVKTPARSEAPFEERQLEQVETSDEEGSALQKQETILVQKAELGANLEQTRLKLTPVRWCILSVLRNYGQACSGLFELEIATYVAQNRSLNGGRALTGASSRELTKTEETDQRDFLSCNAFTHRLVLRDRLRRNGGGENSKERCGRELEHFISSGCRCRQSYCWCCAFAETKV